MTASSQVSNISLSTPMMGAHTTSNIGRTYASPELLETLRTNTLVFFDACLNIASPFLTISFLSSLKASLRLLSVEVWKTLNCTTSSFLFLLPTSCVIEIGAAAIRSYISNNISSGSSPSADIPLFCFTNCSLVILLSSFIAGLCKLVWSIIVENARINAISADAKVSLFCR